MHRALGAWVAPLCAALVWTFPANADTPSKPAISQSAQSSPVPHTPVGFSKLVVRIDGTDDIGIAGGDFRVRLLERMRANGFDAVGAENLVFGKDDSRRAEYVVGGTVRELACRERGLTFRCRIGVEWQVLDVERDDVVYTVMTRVAVLDSPLDKKDRMAGRLIDAALDALLRRPKFRRALAAHDAGTAETAPTFADATLPRCTPGRKIADTADDVLRSVVVIKQKDGFGSGFFVSPDGLVMTAAHVVSGDKLTIRLRDGSEVDAVPVRVAAREDVALLRTTKALSGQRCIAIRTDIPSSGSEAYAAGAPASLDLAFSLTRGIVSGFPTIEGQRRLQTDAPINPGNSGGPIVDANGAVLGVVSFKIVASKIEGVGFAVPMPEALGALHLRLGDTTDRSLWTEDAAPVVSKKVTLIEDDADPVPTLEPEAVRRRPVVDEEEHAPQDHADAHDSFARHPASALRFSGAAVGLLGAITVAATYVQYQPGTTTQADFGSLRTWNTVGWVGVGVGAAAFGLSFVLAPSKGPSSKVSSIRIGPTGISYQGAF